MIGIDIVIFVFDGITVGIVVTITVFVGATGAGVTDTTVGCGELQPAMMIIEMHNKKNEMLIIFVICCWLIIISKTRSNISLLHPGIFQHQKQGFQMLFSP